MNKKQSEFAQKMLQEFLAFTEIPDSQEEIKITELPMLRESDEAMLIVTVGTQELVVARCVVCESELQGMMCGGIVIELPLPEKLLNFSYREGKLSVMEVIANA